MKYMLLVYSPESAWTAAEWTECVESSLEICRELAGKHQLESAAPLFPVRTAATVRVREGGILVTAGPFAETTEQLGGYYLIDVANLDEAISIAARLPPAQKGTVEIRPLYLLDGLPPAGSHTGADGHGGDRKKFLLLCHDDENAWQAAGEAALQAAMRRAVGLAHELHSGGQYLQASPLHPGRTATSVRVRNGQRMVTDGPFAETREVLGGFYLVLASDQAAALAVAARHPGAEWGSVEVREVVELPPVGAGSR